MSAAPARIFAIVVMFIIVSINEPPAADASTRAEAVERVAAKLATAMVAFAPLAERSATRTVAETATPFRVKYVRNVSTAADNSRLATLSEHPTWTAADRWLLF